MSSKEYKNREQGIVTKINKVNGILQNQKIKIEYSMYNYNGIASKLEKSDLYKADVSNAVFIRTHKCNSKYMVDDVVNSCNIKNDIAIEEIFNAKISDIENASIEELVEFFGNMENHEKIGIGKDKKYQITYKGINDIGQDVEVTAIYGKNSKYNVKTSKTQIGKDGTIQKVYSENTINCNNENNSKVKKLFVQGIESSNPELYSVLEKQINDVGESKFSIKCLGNNKLKYSAVAGDDNFEKISSINFGGEYNNYFEYNGKVENAKGKLACRVNLLDNSIIKPNFSKITTLSKASEKAEEFYNQNKNNPTIKFDRKQSKFIVEGNSEDLAKLNLGTVLQNALKGFNVDKNLGIEAKEVGNKKFIRKKI